MNNQDDAVKRMENDLHNLIMEVTEIETVLQGDLPACVRKILTDAMAEREGKMETLSKVLGHER